MPRPIIAQPHQLSDRGDYVCSTDEAARRRSSRGYIARRWALISSSDGREIETGAGSQLPRTQQTPVPQNLLSALAVQLLIICLVTGAFRIDPLARHASATLLDAVTEWLAISVCAALVLLFLLYISRGVSLLRWVLLLLFTIVQCLVLVQLGVLLDSSVCVFNGIFALASIIAMIAISGSERQPLPRKAMLSSSIVTGALAFVTVALAASCLVAAYGDAVATSHAFCVSLALQAVLSLWLAVDASAMSQVLTSDESSDAVVLFYSDLVLLILLTIALTVVVACAAFCAGGGSDCNVLTACAGCNCSGCDSDVFTARDESRA